MGVKYNYTSQCQLVPTQKYLLSDVSACTLTFTDGGKHNIKSSSEKEIVIVKLVPRTSKMQLFRDSVLENYSTSKNASELAASCHYNSLKTFTRHFKQYFKQTPYQWMLEQKMEEVHSLVLNSDISISEIAKLYGFKNVTHLINAYQNKFGVPPKRNRKLYYTQHIQKSI